ncbi:MAG: YggS family pyridoxal phosphate-dependent enzyme [Bacteroidota bacterium]|jgi:hypothetical protein
MNITENIKNITSNLPKEVKLIAVSKTQSDSTIMEAYESGHRYFGENKVQELVDKHENLPKDIEWHFIGHLQTNKVKYIAPFVSLIHGVDSLKLLKEINKQAAKNHRIIDCLLQFHIAIEEAKFGFSLGEVQEIFDNPDYKLLKNIRIVGVMGMATYTNDENQIRQEFIQLKSHFKLLKEKYLNHAFFLEISMGMSADYKIAIEEGSTMIRLGSSIFGIRLYPKF